MPDVTSGGPATPIVSVVVPSFRGASILADGLRQLVGDLTTLGVPAEIIVVDDGSDDEGATRKVAEQFGCRFIELPVNRGKGAAVRAGMRAATGNFRIFTDADAPFDTATLQRAFHYLSFKEFDVVAGDRTLPQSTYFLDVPAMRRLGSAVCSFIVGRFVAGSWFDTQCGIKGFRADVAADLFECGRINRFAFDVELFYLALKRNYDIKRIPVTLRSKGPSSVNLVRDGLGFIADIVRIPLYYYLGLYRRGPR